VRSQNAKRPVQRECRTCLGPHDEEIHDATRRVLGWFGQRMNYALIPWRDVQFLERISHEARQQLQQSAVENQAAFPGLHRSAFRPAATVPEAYESSLAQS
jgi:hypothetical protein